MPGYLAYKVDVSLRKPEQPLDLGEVALLCRGYQLLSYSCHNSVVDAALCGK